MHLNYSGGTSVGRFPAAGIEFLTLKISKQMILLEIIRVEIKYVGSY
jgi:hypothetical protein